jgi:hypothetical protein
MVRAPSVTVRDLMSACVLQGKSRPGRYELLWAPKGCGSAKTPRVWLGSFCGRSRATDLIEDRISEFGDCVVKGGRPTDRPKENSATVRCSGVLAGSNAKCEQCNHTHSGNQHCECYRIVIQPMQPLLHGKPPLFKREGRRDNFSGRSWFRCEGKRPRKTPPLGESCGGVPGPCALGERDKLWGHWGNASGGDAFREPFRSDRIAGPNSDTDICEVKGVGVRSSPHPFLSPAWPKTGGAFS